MKRLIYFDNAATSYPKPKNVISAVSESLMYSGNPGRSGHKLSLYSMKAMYSCREAVCDFFKFSHPENVVFTYNTTYALNMAIKGLMGNDGEIVISNLEHNSVIRPVKELERQNEGISVKVFDALCDNEKTISNFLQALTDNTKLCVITMCSNVTGKILPFREISEICKKRNLTLILDAAQYAGHEVLDLSSLYFSAICFAGHKSLYGIMGTGFCIFSPDIQPSAFIQGGNGAFSTGMFHDMPLPERLEAGTSGVPGIIALHEGIKHITSVGQNTITEKCSYLESRLTQGLSQIKNITIYGKTQKKVSTVLFNISYVKSEETAFILSESGICTRAGLHCAPLCHKALGTLEAGAVRASLSHFNSGEDVDIFLEEIRKIAK